MHRLIPPLHEDEGGAAGESGDVRSPATSSTSVLSVELRANFDAMRAIVRAQQRIDQQLDQQPRGGSGADGQQEAAPDTASKKRKAPRNEEGTSNAVEGGASPHQRRELQKQKFDLAVATAISVEGEISRLANGIAELEALLRSQEDDSAAMGHGAHMPDAAFPFLPLVVPPDDEYEQRNKGVAQKDACCVASLAEEARSQHDLQLPPTPSQDIAQVPLLPSQPQDKKP